MILGGSDRNIVFRERNNDIAVLTLEEVGLKVELMYKCSLLFLCLLNIIANFNYQMDFVANYFIIFCLY